MREVLAETRKCLEEGLARLQLKKRHSAIEPDQLLAKVEEVFSEFRGELDTLEQEQPDVYDDDELRDQIDSLLEGKIGPPPESQSELDRIFEEGRIRYEHKHPPGYGDTGKAQPGERETCSYGGLAFRREYGDLILWFQIIEAAKAKELKHIIFVTDDEKEDWWWTVKSRGKKTIGPRPELVEELHRKAGVSSFYMYNSERFLEFAKQYLGAQVDQESIDQVREIVQLGEAEWKGRRRTSIAYHMQAERAVAQWLRDLCPNDEIVSSERGFPDLVLVSDRDRIGYEVKYIRGEPTFIRHMMRERVFRGYHEINEGRLDSLKFVVVVDDEEEVEKAIDILSRSRYEIPDGISFVVGLLEPSERERGAIWHLSLFSFSKPNVEGVAQVNLAASKC
ncbi:MAG: hypothetical protein E3J21_00110 [Anaerolineales bacterium]|nr:MAG: hypothetical protein E3J21_00110 [Anaerolineales bacterium]